MVKKSKLLAALDTLKGKDYQHGKQKKLQKQAANRKRKLYPPHRSRITEVEGYGGTEINGLIPQVEAEIDGWEGDESKDTTQIAVREPHAKK